ncbi:hypothetical protein GCM10009827_118970 [Dactylosporangium maewongense]|uniref:Uncharacterized protein n=1 Tax=Dactylosporangium maewongense TaxID=634393 RepID=A0ABN2DGY9_9ACTN
MDRRCPPFNPLATRHILGHPISEPFPGKQICQPGRRPAQPRSVDASRSDGSGAQP